MKLRNLFLSTLVVVGFIFTSCSTDLEKNGAVEYHHIFPQQYRNQFAAKGINVDDFTIALTKKDHRGMGTGLQYVPKNWNEEWGNWLQQNPNFTQKMASKKAQQMLQEAGCRGEFHFYDYNTKKLSNATLYGASGGLFLCSNNGFLKFCGKIGYWLIKVLGGSHFWSPILSILAGIGCTVLGWFGIKTEEPVAMGVGLLVIILGILLCIGVFIFAKWIWTVIVIAGGSGGAIVANS